MRNKNKTVWSNRFGRANSKNFQRIGSSINIDKRLYNEDIQASIVHVQMLVKKRIIPGKDGKKIINGLKKIKKEIDRNKFKFKEKFEDIHQNIEKRLFQTIGESAGYLHTARSRNDQVVTDFKIWVKEASLDINSTLNILIRSILKKASININTVMPGFTHLKNAQPISFAHYLLAYVEMLNRDKRRFKNNVVLIDECPLGSAALAGTSFNIDRNYTAKKLGFKKPTNNSIDAVSDRDFAIDFLSAAATCAMHLSRLAEDFIIFNSEAFSFIEFSDKVLTGSSIMPQKKNPDAAELIRAKIGRIFGANVALMIVMKGLPLAYSKDMQEDKEQVFDAADNLMVALAAMSGMIKDLKANKENMEAAAHFGFSTATDLADWLVQKLNLPFREAHHITGQIVQRAEVKKCDLCDLDLAVIREVDDRITEDIYSVLSVQNSVASRASYGGTAPSQVRSQIARWRKTLEL